MNHLEDISSNVDFGPKRLTFGPERTQNGRAMFSRNVNLNFTKEDHKSKFN